METTIRHEGTPVYVVSTKGEVEAFLRGLIQLPQHDVALFQSGNSEMDESVRRSIVGCTRHEPSDLRFVVLPRWLRQIIPSLNVSPCAVTILDFVDLVKLQVTSTDIVNIAKHFPALVSLRILGLPAPGSHVHASIVEKLCTYLRCIKIFYLPINFTTEESARAIAKAAAATGSATTREFSHIEEIGFFDGIRYLPSTIAPEVAMLLGTYIKRQCKINSFMHHPSFMNAENHRCGNAIAIIRALFADQRIFGHSGLIPPAPQETVAWTVAIQGLPDELWLRIVRLLEYKGHFAHASKRSLAITKEVVGRFTSFGELLLDRKQLYPVRLAIHRS